MQDAKLEIMIIC